jgi:hypothetical protein
MSGFFPLVESIEGALYHKSGIMEWWNWENGEMGYWENEFSSQSPNTPIPHSPNITSFSKENGVVLQNILYSRFLFGIIVTVRCACSSEDRALVSGTKDRAFESRQAHFFCVSLCLRAFVPWWSKLGGGSRVISTG